MDEIYYIKELIDFTRALTGEDLTSLKAYEPCPIYYIKNKEALNEYIIFDEKETSFRRVPELAGSRFLHSIKLLEALNKKYVPIYSKEDKKLLFTLDEFLSLRRKMCGLKEYGLPIANFSENLYFPELEPYLEKIDQNFAQLNKHQNHIYDELENTIKSVGLSFDKELELIDIGSTSRGTNIPDIEGKSKSDFDYIIRLEPQNLFLVKEVLLKKLLSSSDKTYCIKDDTYRIRLIDVKIEGVDNLVDIDISFIPQKKKYLSTEAAITEKLQAMRSQDEEKYRLVLANIMYAKDMLKQLGVYKPSRSLPSFERSMGGLGGIGIENWILQNDGSFIDAAKEFTSFAQDRDFIEFQKNYAIMDFGKNHVTVSKGGFPYDNFVQRNMREAGYQKMTKALLEFIESHKKSESIKLS